MASAEKLHTLRPRIAEDTTFVARCYAHGKGRDVALLPEPMRSAVLAQQVAAFDAALTGYPSVVDRIVVVGDAPVGRLVESRPAERWWILDLALLPEAQGKGLGTRVLADVVEEARRSGVAVGLHVRRDHAAIASYERIGFVVRGGDELDLEMVANEPPDR